MGGGALGAFATGLTNSIMIGQQRKAEQDYKKALVEQSKLQTKMLENKLAREQFEQGALSSIAQAAGIPLPQMPQVAPIQSVAAPQQSLLGRIFNPQPPASTQTQTPQAAPPGTIPIVSGPANSQSNLSQTIAQGQMQSQIPQDQAKALAYDIFMKKAFDLPPWQSKFMAEKKAKEDEVFKYVDLGSHVVPVNNKGVPIGGAIPKSMEYDWKESQPEPGGPTMLQPIPKYPNVTGYGVGPQPFIKEQPKGETAEQAGKVQAIVGGLQDGIKFLDIIKDKSTGGINQKTIAGMTAPLMGTVGGMPGTDAREGLSLFRNAVDAIVRQRTGAQIRADEWPYYNSIYLPDYKDSQELQQSKIERLNRDLAGALMQTDPNQTKLNRSLSVTPQQQNKRPSLNLQPAQAMPPPPPGWQVIQGEKSPDGYPIVTDGKTKKRWGP